MALNIKIFENNLNALFLDFMTPQFDFSVKFERTLFLSLHKILNFPNKKKIKNAKKFPFFLPLLRGLFFILLMLW